eukprot:NODE_120_length_17920_cov_0.559782.p2 type:complete len:350 gc:universal NODE_120_length_17920_cov_0.559782:14619-13570(-)
MSKRELLQLLEQVPRPDNTNKFTKNEYKRMDIIYGALKFTIKKLIETNPDVTIHQLINFDQIGNECVGNHSGQTIVNNMCRYLKYASISESKRIGRPKLIPMDKKEDIEIYIEANEGVVTLRSIIIYCFLDCAEATLSTFLAKNLDLRCCRKIRACLLGQRQMDERYRYALSKMCVTIHFWTNIFFGDEAYFELNNCSAGQQFVYRKYGDYSKQSYFKGEVQRSRGIMAYMCISYEFGPIFIHFFEANTSVTANVYQRQIIPKIASSLVNSQSDYRVVHNEPYAFIDDNASSHWGDGSLEALSAADINSLEWPARSPDINPIEGCIGQVKEMLLEDMLYFGSDMVKFKV